MLNKKMKNMLLRHYKMTSEDVELSTAALVELLIGYGSGEVSVHANGANKNPQAVLPPSALKPILDLLSLLMTKNEAAIFVIDPHEEIGLTEASLLSKIEPESINALVESGALGHRMLGSWPRVKVGDVLKIATDGSRSATLTETGNEQI